ncbi:hypothetical protein BC829DRAFT_381125 [Chytridium lagenaria]|nr:hypothetical protein BC829DRAFT_381125 [Chytridium lagenaria]
MSEDDELRPPAKRVKQDGNSTLFLDTVNRYMLDFDFEKLCSVSLSNLNVYACLVCGKYFQGRGPTSHAYFHSVHEDHHVFINLDTLRVFILPDGYEAVDSSLKDIKFVIRPTFTAEEIKMMDKTASYSYDLNNKRYLPGFIGLNNIKANDYVNVIIQTLSHIGPLRDFFLANEYKIIRTRLLLVKRFGILVRKIWNPRAFKGQVSPHELLQQHDPVQFLSWFLNALHFGLRTTKKSSNFQGVVQLEEQTVVGSRSIHPDKTKRSFFSDLDDDAEKNIIPQVPLTEILLKLTGRASTFPVDCQELPRYIIFHIKRFTKNIFTTEKNPTIVHVVSKAKDQWFLIQDLIVEEIAPQMISCQSLTCR